MRYIAVIHYWSIKCKGFSHHELKATTREQAETEATILKFKRQTPFEGCSYTIIEIEEREKLNLIPGWIRKWFYRKSPSITWGY
ncbi:MAG: hypothetical protein N4A71_11030 [Carboxylicivirga sp.]|jgi:hypothetical protein|nr:hypothetical protein [Carboxylicivirga sp.]